MRTLNVYNKKANYDFEILRKFIAGIVLLGSEVKSCVSSQASLKESYVRINKNDNFVVTNMHINKYRFDTRKITLAGFETRERELLLHKKELKYIQDQIKLKNLTCIPIRLLSQNGKIKIEIALAKGLKKWDKREKEKKKELVKEKKIYL